MRDKSVEKAYICKLFHIQGHGELNAAFWAVGRIAIQATDDRAHTVNGLGVHLHRNLTSLLDFCLLSVMKPGQVRPLVVLIFALCGH